MVNIVTLEQDLRMIRAPNPSALTGEGTNTFLLGDKDVCILDPGPDDDAHLNAILGALDPTARVAAILVTHSHLDHSALVPKLAARTKAPVLAFGTSKSGRSDLMQKLATYESVGGGEGVDPNFRPDRYLTDGEVVQYGSGQITAIWTPGHMGNHMCFKWRDAIFSGDHVMGWATSLVSPPDGDLGAFMRSLTRLDLAQGRILYPAHGSAVNDPAKRIQELRVHRQTREAQILAGLADGHTQILSLVAAIYTDTPTSLHKAAARNVFAHLIDLWERGLVDAHPHPTLDSCYSIRDKTRNTALL